MADITTLYETVDAKDGTIVVTINGVPVSPVWRVTWRFDIGRVPSATIWVPNPIPAGAAYFGNVTVDAGFNGIVQRVFTGIVLDTKNDAQGSHVECVGKSWALDVPYQDILLYLPNISSEDAITDLLQDAGILDFQVNVPSWTIGTVAPQTLRFQTFGEAITKIAEVDGCRWYETPSGQVVVRVVPPVPSLGISRQYFSMQLTGLVESYPPGIVAGRPRLRRCQRHTRVRLTKNEVLVRGALVTEEIAPGVESSHDITALVQAPSPYVLNPDGSQAYNDLVVTNELIDTEPKGDEVADRLLVLHNRLWVFVAVTVDGDPRISLVETHQIEDPAYSRVTGNWFVEGYSTTFSQQDFSTVMQMRGLGGLPNQDPIADFSWVVEREVMDGREYLVLTVDGRASFDPDGTIASYSWTDNQGPIVAGATAVVTVRADPDAISAPWEVTLTVTDNNGATNSVTKTITMDCDGAGVFTPSFYAALGNNFSASPDGGQSWADQAGVDVVSVAASPATDGVAVYGTSAGAIYRTDDFNQTAPSEVLAAVGSEIKHLWWDTNDNARVWAITKNARLYRSTDEGVTWSLYVALRTKLKPKRNWIANRIDTLSRGGSNVVRVFGGDGKGKLMIVYDIGLTNKWSFAKIGGELQDDVGGSGPNDLIVFDAAFHSSGELAIILNSTTQTPSVYYTTDIFGDGSAWARAIADPAKPQGRWIEPDLEADRFVLAFNDQAIYTGDVAAGVMTLAVAAATLDAGYVPNHGLWLGRSLRGIGSVYVVAADAPVAAGDIATGTYSGSGLGQAINVGFEPILVIIFQEGNRSCMIKGVDSVWGTKSAEMDGSMNTASGILSLTATGFTVGIDQNVDQAFQTYRYLAIGGDDSLINTGKYVSPGPPGGAVAGVGFPPVMVTVHMDGPIRGVVKTNTMSGLDSKEYGSDVFQTDEITSLNADGYSFGAGGSANSLFSDDFYWIAFSEALGLVLSSYVGDGVDGREIAVGDFVWLMLLPDLTEAGHMKIDTMAADAAKEILNNGAVVPNVIQDDDPFEVGDDDAANKSPESYHWVGLKVAVESLEGVLYKTVDRFATIGKLRPATGFPAMPFDTNAKMTAIGPGGCPADFVYVQQAPGSDPSSPATYPKRVAKLTALWTLQSDPTSIAQRNTYFLKRVGANLYRGDGFNQALANQLHPGQLQRSTDDGVTWADVGPSPVIDGADIWGVQALVAGADGTLWLCCCVNTSGLLNVGLNPPQVWKSVDGGAIWTFVMEDTTLDTGRWRRFLDIVAHPSDSQVIVVIADRFDGVLNTQATDDGGSSWTRLTGAFIADTAGRRMAVMMDNGRIVALMSNNGDIGYSDDYGVTWTDASESFTTYAYEIIRAGNVLFASGGSATAPIVKRSFDYGQTWTTIVDDLSMTAEVTSFQGIVYSPQTDSLYICTDSELATERVFVLKDARQPVVGALMDVSFDLDSLLPEAAPIGEICRQGIAL